MKLDAKALSALDLLKGEQTVLKRVLPAEAASLVPLFRERAVHRPLGWTEPLSKEKIEVLLKDANDFGMLVWKVCDTTRREIGTLIWSNPVGNECLHTHAPSAWDEDLRRDAEVTFLKTFFALHTGSTPEPVFRHELMPVDPSVHALLTGWGWDYIEDPPDADPTVEHTYMMYRETFDAYYGEEADEEE